MSLNALWLVVSKEVMDALRDRRSILAGLMFAVLGPFAVAAALKAMIDSELAAEKQTVQLVGAAFAPGLRHYLEMSGVRTQPAEGTPAQVLGQAPDELVLVVPTEAPRALAEGREAKIELWADLSDSDVQRRAQRLQGLVAAYGAELAERRLLGAGVPPAAASALELEVRNMASPGGKAGMVLAALPLFWLLGVFIGGSHVALDATAGERDRRSLESLLAQPMTARVLFVGKWLTASLFGYASGAIALLLSVLMLSRLPLHELGIAFSPDGLTLVWMLLLMLPLALLAGALQCTLALNAGTHKEAQIYLNLLQLAPMVLMVEGLDATSTPAAHLLPLFSQHAQLTYLFTGQELGPVAVGLSLLGCASAAIMLAWAGGRRLGSERFVFGL